LDKKKLYGFTLIEMIVAIAIIAALAAILIPTLMGFVKDARVSKLNVNARHVFNAANLAVSDAEKQGILENSAAAAYTGSSDGLGRSSANGSVLDLSKYLGDSFEGYFGFRMSDGSRGAHAVVCAVWSENPLDESLIAPMSYQDVEDSMNANPRGCYPLSDDNP
jgi:prepilin-type N-terminal cleavage/methylation domain-containing protein